jgi:hypothetical protein
LHPKDNIEIVRWRSSLDTYKFYDIVYVCGFDKDIYNQRFKKFIYKGYLKQFFYLKRIKLINNNLKIIYIGTKTKNKFIVSRYDFIKNRLAYKLTLLGGFYNVQLDFIIDNKGLPISNYGTLYLIGFRILRACGLLQVCTLPSVKIALMDPKLNSIHSKCYRYMFIKFPRPMIVDKIMKLFFLFIA